MKQFFFSCFHSSRKFWHDTKKNVPSSAGICCSHCSSGYKRRRVRSCGNGCSRALKSPAHILLPHSPAYFLFPSWSRKPLLSKPPFSGQPPLSLLFSPKEVLPSCLFKNPQLEEKRLGQFAWVDVAHCSRCQACVCCNRRLLILSSRKQSTTIISQAGRAVPPLVQLGQTSCVECHRRHCASRKKLNTRDRVSRWSGSSARGAGSSARGSRPSRLCRKGRMARRNCAPEAAQFVLFQDDSNEVENGDFFLWL